MGMTVHLEREVETAIILKDPQGLVTHAENSITPDSHLLEHPSPVGHSPPADYLLQGLWVGLLPSLTRVKIFREFSFITRQNFFHCLLQGTRASEWERLLCVAQKSCLQACLLMTFFTSLSCPESDGETRRAAGKSMLSHSRLSQPSLVPCACQPRAFPLHRREVLRQSNHTSPSG